MIFSTSTHHTFEKFSGFIPAAVVQTMEVTQQVPDTLVWLSYLAAASTLLLNVPKIWKGFHDMFVPPRHNRREEDDEDERKPFDGES